jgi:hypothetical protein
MSDTQVAIFYIHGTINTPANNSQAYISDSSAPYKNIYGNNNVMVNNTFSWSDRADLFNNCSTRGEAAEELVNHVNNYVQTGIANGSIDINRPLKIVLNGYSHGGNVNLQAASAIARIEASYGIKNMSIDVNNYSTPQHYNNIFNTINRSNNPEDPAVVKNRVKRNSNGRVTINHNTFSTAGDAVANSGGLALGGKYPENGITRQFNLTAPNTGINVLDPRSGLEKHGAVITDPATRQQAAMALSGVLRNQKAKENHSQRTTGALQIR